MWLKNIQAQESDKHLSHFGKIEKTRAQRRFEVISVALVLCSWERGEINLSGKSIASERTTV